MKNRLLYLLFPAFILLISCKSTRLPGKADAISAERKSLEKSLGIPLPAKYDPHLLNYLSGWMKTPYRYGAATTKGTDCSGLVKSVYRDVFGISLERSASGQKEKAKRISQSKLKEGDLVFFSIQSKQTDHVGIYLWDSHFIHASTRSGVIISSLSEPYYKKTYSGAGTYRH